MTQPTPQIGALGIRRKEEIKWVLGSAQVEGSDMRRMEVGKEEAASKRKE